MIEGADADVGAAHQEQGQPQPGTIGYDDFKDHLRGLVSQRVTYEEGEKRTFVEMGEAASAGR